LQGSGSASRSIYGGCVEWKGLPTEYLWKTIESKDVIEKISRECIAKQVFEPEYFSDIEILIVVTKEKEKDTPSTDGMKLSVETSELLKYRAEKIVPTHMEKIKTAIVEKDWHTVFEVTMRDSNNFHATCCDTYPPIFYMSESSHSIIRTVDLINRQFKTNKLAYTYDAGPNAVLIIHKSVFVDCCKFFF